jgi:predicted RNase H-like HicB family nuclease
MIAQWGGRRGVSSITIAQHMRVVPDLVDERGGAGHGCKPSGIGKGRGAACQNRLWWSGTRLGKAMTTFTAYIEFDEETKLYVGSVPGIPGAHTQAASLDELRANLHEVLELCLEEQTDLRDQLPKFVGVQQIEVA